jgi:hypothetical protein
VSEGERVCGWPGLALPSATVRPAVLHALLLVCFSFLLARV